MSFASVVTGILKVKFRGSYFSYYNIFQSVFWFSNDFNANYWTW